MSAAGQLFEQTASQLDGLAKQASQTLDNLAAQASGALRQPRRPVCRILLGGKDITHNITPRLISLALTDNRGFEADQLDIVLDDSDGKLDIPERGVTVKLALGWADGPLVDKSSYIVDEVEHTGAPDTLTLRARATDLRAGIATKREKSWHKTTVGAIVQAIHRQSQRPDAGHPRLASQAKDRTHRPNQRERRQPAQPPGRAVRRHRHRQARPADLLQSR
ncbi:hypothetical protein JOS77_06675 [Chromobacterium haemolyticum]|nr:hypothetical protein JOS77_06675 [Chromobacterium haemolyticum]